MHLIFDLLLPHCNGLDSFVSVCVVVDSELLELFLQILVIFSQLSADSAEVARNALGLWSRPRQSGTLLGSWRMVGARLLSGLLRG